MKNTQMIPALMGAVLLSVTAVNAEIKFMNSVQCAEKIPAAKELMVEGEKIQKTGMAELKGIEQNAQKVIAEIQKERTDLMAKSTTMSADAKYKEEKKIKDKEHKVEEMQGEYQRVMHNIESEMQMVQMRLQPYLVEVIQNAQEVASKNPSVDAIWDNATKQFVYNKETLDLSPEVMKLTEKKNEQKTTLAKNKPAAPKPAATKVA